MAEAGADSAQSGPGIAEFKLTPIHGSSVDAWTVQLEAEVLSLISSSGDVVMMLPREEAARHIRFAFEVFAGRTVAFVVVEGLKSYRFRCPGPVQRALLEWLPHKAASETAREVRVYGAALLILGAAYLFFWAYVPWPWGAALFALGAANVAMPRHSMFLVNGLALLPLGLGMLLALGPLGSARTAAQHAAQILSAGFGSILVIWAIQQLSLWSPNQRLAAARLAGDDAAARGLPERSRAVRIVALAAAAIAGLLTTHCVIIAADALVGGHPAPVEPLVVYAAPAAALAAAAGVLALRRRAAYVEAKLTGQFAVVLTVLYAAGLIELARDHSSLFWTDTLPFGVGQVVNPMLWAGIVAFVVLFNGFYSRAVERELEEHRG